MSRDIQAEAFTHGSDIYFNRSKFNPGGKGGRHLLAHELTHVVQQTGASVQRSPQASIQRKWRSPKQWWSDRKEKKAKEKAELDTVNYDSLEGLKKGQVLPEVGKMAERRMKDMMKYDDVVMNIEVKKRFGEDALALIDDDSVKQQVIDAATNDAEDAKFRKRIKMPDPSEEHFKTLATIVRQVCADFDATTIPSSGGIESWLLKQVPETVTQRPLVISLLQKFVPMVEKYSGEHAKYSAKGLRPENKYEGLPGMSQTETFMEERKNVQFEKVTVAPEDIPALGGCDPNNGRGEGAVGPGHGAAGQQGSRLARRRPIGRQDRMGQGCPQEEDHRPAGDLLG